ncbi:hypothetical protein HYC85_029356 [Camellia sinensis]|uniref:VOC domain-containing protein n=1 Tax=Camellia sinensis TaxID=4442 RepID=A0A7J7FXW4_CAMSI|nr:hypothetical protein HYC85_029356 [Camellia sinensis]
MKENLENPLRLTSLNHVSLVCRSLEKSIDFYTNVHGFVPVRRPNSRPRTYDEEKQNQSQGQSYFIPVYEIKQLSDQNVELAVRLVKRYACEIMAMVEKKLKEMGIECMRQMVEEGGIHIDQLFFHDPDGFIIEICNYDNIPIVPLSGEVVRSCYQVNLNKKMQHQQQQIQASETSKRSRSPLEHKNGSSYGKTTSTAILLFPDITREEEGVEGGAGKAPHMRGEGRTCGGCQEGVKPTVVEVEGVVGFAGVCRKYRSMRVENQARENAVETRVSFLTREFFRAKPDEFHGGLEPKKVDKWLEQTVKTFEMLHIEDSELRVILVSYYLKGDAGHWWKYANGRIEPT